MMIWERTAMQGEKGEGLEGSCGMQRGLFSPSPPLCSLLQNTRMEIDDMKSRQLTTIASYGQTSDCISALRLFSIFGKEGDRLRCASTTGSSLLFI